MSRFTSNLASHIAAEIVSQIPKVGDAVRVNRCAAAPRGYLGTITEVCTGQLAGMVVVRLERGSVCVDISELDR